jgi:hypothetical protein
MSHLQRNADGHLLRTPVSGHLLKGCTCLCLCCTTPIPDTVLLTVTGLSGTLGLLNGTWALTWEGCCEWWLRSLRLSCPANPEVGWLFGDLWCRKPNGSDWWVAGVSVKDQAEDVCYANWRLFAGPCDPRGTYALWNCQDADCACGPSCPTAAACVVSYP